jgi:5-methyltetrahydropteroyltriglutamate--homocysteine methyltransferase
MKTTTQRILTTHTGSIARPDDLIELMRAKENSESYDTDAFETRVTSAAGDCVRRQVACSGSC